MTPRARAAAVSTPQEGAAGAPRGRTRKAAGPVVKAVPTPDVDALEATDEEVEPTDIVEDELEGALVEELTVEDVLEPAVENVKFEREGDDVVLTVKDNGIGISAALLPRVFEQFVQGERTLDRSRGGLGLGLSIVRSLVEQHGGTVAARSEGARQGSEFVVRLPLDLSRPITGVGAVPSPQTPGDQRPPARVLVVDDNLDAADLFAEALRAAGHEVRAAYDGPSGLQAAEALVPEVAFIDIGLPLMDGYEVAQRLREAGAGRRLYLVAVTGYGQESDRERSRAAGFDLHLVKPVDLDRVLAIAARPERTSAQGPEGTRADRAP